MKNLIIENLNNPAILEKLYRSDKLGFEQSFNVLYPEFKEQPIVQYWNERINYIEQAAQQNSKKGFWTAIQLAVIAGLIANISNLPGVNADIFFSKNLSFIIIPFLAAFFMLKQNLGNPKKGVVLSIFVLASIYINVLPNINSGSSVSLAYIHLPLFLWCVLGFAYLGNDVFSAAKRIQFLKYNGDFIVLCVVMFLASMLFSGITLGLFELIGLKIGSFYFQYIAIWGLGAIPIIATYLIENNPKIINKVTPVIAQIFTPLVFINLTIYLSALIIKGKYPYQDRNLLLVYNALLVGVLALIFFSIAETEKSKHKKYHSIVLLGLSILTIIVNSIALSAICYRLFEYGITPNRVAVLGGNLIIFINLLLVAYQLIQVLRNKSAITEVEKRIAQYLPVYAVWTGIIAFILPLVFGFK